MGAGLVTSSERSALKTSPKFFVTNCHSKSPATYLSAFVAVSQNKHTMRTSSRPLSRSPPMNKKCSKNAIDTAVTICEAT